MRRIININQNWQFIGPNGKTEAVDLPHTWNAADGQDGGNDYVRGAFLYRRFFDLPQFDAQRELVYLQFYGVNASCTVTLNGVEVCSHDGGYSTFRREITSLLQKLNEMTVLVDNGPNDRVYPQKADFTFYGGIYRDVELLIVGKAHFDLDYYGSDGFQVTPAVEGKAGKVRAVSYPVGNYDGVKAAVLDAEGREVASAEGVDVTLTIEEAHLWDGIRDPYLYTAVFTLFQEGRVVDQVSARFGVRTFGVDAKNGFLLNGRPYPLRGVSRHQDRKGLGNAITGEMHREDMDLICEMGCNTVRLAHYQHDQYFYDLCDERGMVVWAEIPYISEHMPYGRANTICQMKELIVQNHHHACIACWGISNEITISTRKKADMLENHRLLNKMCHKMDPTRFTTLACYAMCGPFNRVAHITDAVSWNLYLGWYVPGLFLNNLWADFFHTVFPKRPLGFSEYGAEGMPNLHSSHPHRGDYTEEYQARYHEYLLDFIDKRPWMWATYVWNMFDFAADARDQGGEPGMNHKGLVTFDRKIKKDSFYLYKAWWSSEPFVHLCSGRYVERAESETMVRVYSNQPRVSLYMDGKLMEEKSGSHVFTFTVSLTGEHHVRAVAGEHEDTAEIRRVDKPNPDYILGKKGKSSANWV